MFRRSHPLLVVVGFFLIWEALGRAFHAPNFILPLPSVIFLEIWRNPGWYAVQVGYTGWECLLGFFGQARVGREHHGQTAGALHRLDVAEPEQRGGLLPYAPARLLERGAHADHGTCHASNHRIKQSRRACTRQIGQLRASQREAA